MGFSSVLGQEMAMGILRHLHQKGQRPPFLIFSGSPGVGKKKAAFEYAKSIMCETPHPKEGGCDCCESCGKVARLTHADVLLVDLSYQQALGSGRQVQSGAIKIDTIRQTLKTVSLRPYSGVSVICIVDGAEALTLSAQNAALKCLEEAPSYLIWIWLTLGEELLLPTICSRASFRIHFKPLSQPVISQLLLQEFKTSSDQIAAVAGACLGSMERARRMIEMGFSSSKSFEFLDGPDAFSKKEVMALSQRIVRFRNYASARKLALEFLEELKVHLFSRWRLSSDAQSLKRLKRVLSAQKDLEANISPPLVLEDLLLSFKPEAG